MLSCLHYTSYLLSFFFFIKEEEQPLYQFIFICKDELVQVHWFICKDELVQVHWFIFRQIFQAARWFKVLRAWSNQWRIQGGFKVSIETPF